MTWQSVARVAEHSKSRLGARLVMLMLANHDAELGCFVSIDRLAKEANLSPRQVLRCLSELEAMGELGIERGTGPHGTNRYTFLLPQPLPHMTDDNVSRDIPTRDKAGPEMSPEQELILGVEVGSTASASSLLNSARLGAERLFAEDFWPRYPRKASKRAALRAFKSALSRAPVDAILTGLIEALPEFASRPADKVPYAATWLNADGWMDEHPDVTDAIDAHIERMRRSAS